MSKVLYFDCFSGASGDMILGALIDAGLPIEELRRALGSLALDGMSIEAESVDRAGVAAIKFRLLENGQVVDSSDPAPKKHRHDHDHHSNKSHHHHSHRSIHEILELVGRANLSESAKASVGHLFGRLATAEAAIHQMPVNEVHLHEVGALDSIIDIVGAAFGFEWFAPDEVVVSPLNVGSGTVECAHGTYPVPAPATARLLEGSPIYASGESGELVTPTGALLMTEWATSYGPLPPMTISRVGYGAGERNRSDSPNVLRLLVGESADIDVGERVVVLECEIDDMNPQIFGLLMSRLHEAGALDVFYIPVQMKKDRPGTLVTVIAPLGLRETLSELLFRESTTLGIRYHETRRERLERTWVTVETSLGAVRIKLARRDNQILNTAPEFDDCLQLARQHDVPVKHVQALAQKAYLDMADQVGRK